MYFTQYQPGTSFTNTTRLRWLEGSLSTGLLHGGLLSTVNGTTTFNVSSGSGIIVTYNATTTADPYPTIKYVQWNNFVSQSLTYSGSAQITYVAIDQFGAVSQLNSAFTVAQFKDRIILGRVLHQTGSVTNGTISTPSTAYAVNSNTQDFFRAFGPLKVSGQTLAASGSTLGITRAAGDSYVEGRNYSANPNIPNYILAADDPALTTPKIYYEWVSGSSVNIDTNGGVGYTAIRPAFYNLNGTVTAISPTNNKYTIQRVFWFPKSVTRALFVYYGSTIYSTLADAIGAINNEPNFVEGDNTKSSAVYLGAVVLEANTTDLTVTSKAQIVNGGLFRGAGGGGSGGGGSTGGGTPGGVNQSIQYNDAGTFNGSSNFTYDTVTLTLNGNFNLVGTGSIDFDGGTLTGSLARFTTMSGSVITGSTALYTTITGSTVTGSTALFTIVTGSTVTGSTALFTIVTGSTVTGSTALFTNITASSLTMQGDLTISNDKSLLMTEGSFYNLTRAMPTATGSTVEIGTISNSNFAANCELWYNVHSSGFAQSKRYFFPLSYNATNGAWQKLFPASTTGQYSGEDADIDVNVLNLTASLRIRRTAYFAYPNATVDLVLFVNGSNTTFTPTSASATGAATPTVVYAVKAEGQLTDYLGAGLSTVPITNRSLIMANTMVTDSGSYALNNWNGTGVRVPIYSSCPSNNGGSTPAVSQPALVLARQGVSGQAYGNFAEFKIRRWEASGVAARTGMDIALTHNNGDAAGTNIMTLQSNGNVGIGTLTPTAVLNLKAGTATANTAPLKFASGSLLTAPESGSIEFTGDNLYLTITSSTARKNVTLDDGLTFGQIPFTTGSGRLAGSSALTYTASNSTLNMSFNQSARTAMVITNNSTNAAAEAGYVVSSSAGASFFGAGSSASSRVAGTIIEAINGSTPTPITFWTNGVRRATFSGTDGYLGIGIASATAYLHIKAGTATANTAPLKFNSGTLMGTPEAGAVEFLTDKYYFTITTGGARKEVALNDAALTSGLPVYATTNGRLTTTATGGNVVAVTSSATPVTVPATGGHIRVIGTAGAKTVTMPTGSGVTVGTIFTIKDAAGNAGSGTITINRTGTDTIDGATSQTITTNYGVLTIIYATAGRFELI